MAAALKARESGVEKIIILERAETLGGILEQCIHTGFGLHYFGEELSGPEYAARFIELVEDTDIVVKTDTMVLSISDDNVVTAVNKEDGLIEIDATAVILAMGCRERPRGALNIAGTRCGRCSLRRYCAEHMSTLTAICPARKSLSSARAISVLSWRAA